MLSIQDENLLPPQVGKGRNGGAESGELDGGAGSGGLDRDSNATPVGYQCLPHARMITLLPPQVGKK